LRIPSNNFVKELLIQYCFGYLNNTMFKIIEQFEFNVPKMGRIEYHQKHHQATLIKLLFFLYPFRDPIKIRNKTL
jgi:hypothetical protein